jgi:hypothetical protein
VLRRRLDRTSGPAALDAFACSSYEELRARSAVLAYVVGEGHEDETIFELAWQFSPSPDSAAVEGAIRDLVGEELLTIEAGKVVSGSAWVSDLVNP